MPMRLGTRAFFKSLLLMAGLPSLLAAQGPAALPSYQPSGYLAQPPSVTGVPNVVAPPIWNNQSTAIQNRNGSTFAAGGSGYLPQAQNGPFSTQPSTATTSTSAAPSASQVISQQPSSNMPTSQSQAVPGTVSQPTANVAVSGSSVGIPAQPVGFGASVQGKRSDSLTPTSGSEAFGKLKPFPSLSSTPMVGGVAESDVAGNGESLRINAPAQFASFQESEYSAGEPIASSSDSCADAPWCSGPSNSGYFASLEALLFFVNKPNVATFGDEASERLVSVNSVVYSFENSLDTSWMSNDGGWGQRFEFGNIKCDSGWFASFWNIKQVQSYNVTGVNFAPSDPFTLMSGFVDGNGDGIDDDLNNNQIYGRSGQDLGTFDSGPPPGFIPPFDGTPDVGAPTDTNDMIVYLQTFSQVASSNKLTMQNFELNRLLRLPGHNWNNEFDYYYGVRYLKVRDQYDVTATGGFLDQSFWHAESDNNLIGPQIGARWSRRARAIGFSVDGRFLAAYNQQDNDLRGQYA
ncbi:MAG: hypothetical protein RLY14_1266, partial [Planctomycetota bacterium]